MTRRGLTLVEVLLALAMLSLLALVTAELTVDLRLAHETETDLARFDRAAIEIEGIVGSVSTPLRLWEVGRSEAASENTRITRLACPTCPDRFGRFEIEVGVRSDAEFEAITLTRFYEVAAVPLPSTSEQSP